MTNINNYLNYLQNESKLAATTMSEKIRCFKDMTSHRYIPVHLPKPTTTRRLIVAVRAVRTVRWNTLKCAIEGKWTTLMWWCTCKQKCMYRNTHDITKVKLTTGDYLLLLLRWIRFFFRFDTCMHAVLVV